MPHGEIPVCTVHTLYCLLKTRNMCKVANIFNTFAGTPYLSIEICPKLYLHPSHQFSHVDHRFLIE